MKMAFPHPHSPSNTHNVVFFTDVIYTTVTTDPSTVSQWIRHVTSLHGHRLLVGLDIEWRPNTTRGRQQNPAAVLQLCIGRCCLVYQLIHSPYIPLHLIQFLSYSNHTFLGIGVESDLEKLRRDYRIGHGSKAVDLRGLAVDVFGAEGLKQAGLKTMAMTVLGRKMEKPKAITVSGWDNRLLTADQVRYACIDAFVSFEIGRVLNAASGCKLK